MENGWDFLHVVAALAAVLRQQAEATLKNHAILYTTFCEENFLNRKLFELLTF